MIANTILLERFEKEGNIELFDDYETVCLLLELAGVRGDRNNLADSLLDSFGSLKGILEARMEQLTKINGIGPKTAAMIRVIVPFAKVWERLNMENPKRIGNSYEAETYCKSLLMGFRHEVFYVICLNAQCRIIGKRKISDGSLSEVNAYPRMIMETALNYNANSILMTHNHPGGTLSPSPEDISSTIKVQQLMNAVGIIVMDHILIAGNNAYSMIQHGDINYRIRGGL